MKKILVPILTLDNKKKNSANFGPTFFWLELEKLAKIFVSDWLNFFISGYGEPTLFIL